MKSKLLLILLFFGFYTQAQETVIIATKLDFVSITNKDFVGRDQYGYHYFVDNNVLYKIKNQEQWEYKNVSLGKLSKVDITNPLKIVLFYENFNTVVLLDNQLSETQKINFSENNLPISITATGLASQNQLWVYNRLEQQIGRYDYLKNSYRSITTPFPEMLLFYQTDFNYFYWIDDKKNAFVCNLNGKITTLEKIYDYESLSFISPQQYLYSMDKKLYYVDTHLNKKYSIGILEKRFEKYYYKDQILSIFTAEGISNYKITIP